MLYGGNQNTVSLVENGLVIPTDCISVWKPTNKEHRGHLLSEHASVSLKPTQHVML